MCFLARLIVFAAIVPAAVPVLAQLVTVAGALPGDTPHAADTEHFTQLEEGIRKDYVASHPIAYKDLFGPTMAKLVREEQVPLETKFSAEMTRSVLGQMMASPDPMKRPSYLKQRAFSMLTLLPFGDVIQKATEVAASQRALTQDSTSASDKLAMQNLENFKKIVGVYGEPGAANRFDSASPVEKVQLFLDAFKIYLDNDLAFPNPYTVWVLDEDDTDEEHPERPHYSHSVLNHMAGLGNPDDYAWESYSREHKTEVLHQAFLHLTDVADQMSHRTREEEKVYEFAKLVGLDVTKSGKDIVEFYDPVYNQHFVYRDFVLSVFGKEGLAQLDKQSDPTEKGATQLAAFIMYFSLQRVVAGALVQ